ncbi:MAG: DUF2237 domain-containing protein [Pseudomonadota bacterium]
MIELDPSINVLGDALEPCGTQPMTGFLRDGYCNTCDEDAGSHTVCVELTNEFLEFSKSAGNDLSTPRPEWGFPGLKEGSSWCLCAERWKEANASGHAPRVFLTRTHKKALDVIPLTDLITHAVDLN